MNPTEREQMVERGARAIAPSAFIEDESAPEDVLHIRAHDRAVALRDASMVLHVAGWRPEWVVKAEALREAAAYIKGSQYGAPLPVSQVFGILHGRATYLESGDAL